MRTKLEQSEKKVNDYAELQNMLDEAESTIIGLSESLESYTDLHKVD